MNADLTDWLNDRIRQLSGSPIAGDRALRSRLLTIRAEVTTGRECRRVVDQLVVLCPCGRGEECGEGPRQECPVHGDGATFVAEVLWLRRVREAADESLDGHISSHNALVDLLAEGPSR